MDELDKSNLKIDEESVSVVISETDFLDETAKTRAVDLMLRASEDEFERPHISAVRATLNILIPLSVTAALFCVLFFTVKEHTLAISLGVSLGALFLYVLLRLRAILIWFVRVYQRFAPADVRRRCVFTPTCSQYAIQALEKYGAVRGVIKLFARLLRCHLPNGGYDPLK